MLFPIIGADFTGKYWGKNIVFLNLFVESSDDALNVCF